MEAKEKKTEVEAVGSPQLKLHEAIKEKMDGRTNVWLWKKTAIAKSDLSRIINGRLIPTDMQLERINIALGTNFQQP